VSWFKRKKPRIEFVNEPIPMSTILRWIMYDTGIQDDRKLTSLVGLTPVSDEGNTKEIEDSEDRLTDIYDILPFLEMISELTANLLSTMHMKDVSELEPDNEIDIEEIEMMKSLYKSVGMAASISAFSTGVKLGLVDIKGMHFNPEDMEGLYEF
jgi:hypothetical protein